MPTATLRPTADGATLNFTPTPSGTHYTCIDEDVTDPNAGDTDDYLTAGATYDIVTATLADVASVSQVIVHTYGNDTGGGLDLDIGNDGSSWETADTLAYGVGDAWDTSTWSGLSWSINGTLTLYWRLKQTGTPNGVCYTMYAIVTYVEYTGGVDMGSVPRGVLRGVLRGAI